MSSRMAATFSGQRGGRRRGGGLGRERAISKATEGQNGGEKATKHGVGKGRGISRLPWQESKLFRESCKTKWFLKESRFGRDLVIHSAFRVSGHIDDMNIRLKVPDLAGKLGATKLGHDDVGEENIDRGGMMACEFESVQGALRLENVMTSRPQVFGDGEAEGDFVVDEKNCERC